METLVKQINKIHKIIEGRVTFLINLMFSRLEKIEVPLFEEAYIQGAYICNVNWLTNLGGAYIQVGLHIGVY